MKEKCKTCNNKYCARKVSIFSSLSDEDIQKISLMTGDLSFEKGELIVYEGEKANRLYLINQGQVKLSKYNKQGKEQILHILSSGDFFGELNLLKAGTYSFNAEAITEVRVCTLHKKKLKNLIMQKPEIALKTMEVIGENLSELQTLAQNLATNEVEVRLAQLLLNLKKEYGTNTNNGTEIIMPITREDMSNYTGVARETISRKLSKFQQQGIIELIGNKKVIIKEESELKKYL